MTTDFIILLILSFPNYIVRLNSFLKLLCPFLLISVIRIKKKNFQLKKSRILIFGISFKPLKIKKERKKEKKKRWESFINFYRRVNGKKTRKNPTHLTLKEKRSASMYFVLFIAEKLNVAATAA